VTIVVLITCTKNKHKGTQKAEYLYSKSPNFRKYLECAKKLTSRENIYVISALHKLVPLDKEIDWYDYTLNNRSEEENYAWGKEVASQLEVLYVFGNTKFIAIADEDYCTFLKPYLKDMDMPLDGIGCGPQGYGLLDDYVHDFM
jgi:hypothetical protein